MAPRPANGGHMTVLPSLCNLQVQESMAMDMPLSARLFIVSWLLSGCPVTVELYVSLLYAAIRNHAG